MHAPRSESFLVVPLFPVFLIGAFPLFLMGFLGFAGLAILGVLMMSAALTVGLDADTEFKVQTSAARLVDRTEAAAQSTARDAMVRFAKAVGICGALLVAVSAAGFAIYS